MMNTATQRGYKHTSLGWLPNDWEARPLRDVAKVQGGFAFDSKKFLPSGKFQVVKMSNVYNDVLDLNRSASFLNELNRQEKPFLLRRGEILITLTGTVGKRDYGYTYKIEDEENLLLNQRVARIVTDGELAISAYLFYQLKNKRVIDQFFHAARGGTGNQANVSTSDVEQIRIPLSPLPEQRRIAAILSTWDAAIETLTALIAEKREAKRGLMQRLLNYYPESTTHLFGDVVKLNVGKTPSRSNKVYWNLSDAKHTWLTIADLKGQEVGNSKERITDAAVEQCKMRLVKKGTLVFSFKLTIGKMARVLEDVYTNEAIAAVLPNENIVSGLFLQYILPNILHTSEKGEAVKGKTFNQEQLKNLELELPPLEYQHRVAAILSAADEEINLLGKQLSALAVQKRGLMQQLLTGKKRVAI